MSKKFIILSMIAFAAMFLAACASNPPSLSQQPTTSNANQASNGQDSDQDGIPDEAEVLLGTDPQNADTDGDSQNDLNDNLPLQLDNPIVETSTDVGFTINAIAVENNVDENGADAPDHLELTVSNNSQNDLNQFELYYSLTDTNTQDTQSFYMPLDGFSLKADQVSHIHVDISNQAGHFRADPNSLFYTGQHSITVSATLHNSGYAPQTISIDKDDPSAEAGGD